MAFERDLGYLDKFFDNLEAHAGTLGGEGGARLAQLVGEERARWVEIRALLGTSPDEKAAKTETAKTEAAKPETKKPEAAKPASPEPQGASAEEAKHAGTRPPVSANPQTADVTAAATRQPAAGFTVGSLRGR